MRSKTHFLSLHPSLLLFFKGMFSASSKTSPASCLVASSPLLLLSFFCLFLTFFISSFTIRHMREIQALHSRQKEEIDSLFTKLGKVTLVCFNAGTINVLSHTSHSKQHSSLGLGVGSSCRSAPSSCNVDWQEETTYQKQIL